MTHHDEHQALDRDAALKKLHELIEDVEVAVLGHVHLQHLKAVAMDGAHEHRTEGLASGAPAHLLDPQGDAAFQLSRRAQSRNGHSWVRVFAGSIQVGRL